MKRTILLACLATLSLSATPALFEEFDDFSALSGFGWVFVNNSIQPGSNWFADTRSSSIAGLTDAILTADFSSTLSFDPTGAHLSNWLLTPQLNFSNGSVFRFFTSSAGGFPDRLEVRLSTNGASNDTGGTDSSVGDFTTLLLAINPNLDAGQYPETWTQYSLTLSGLSGVQSGRFAFRYFVTDGGANGLNSSSIGIDQVELSSTAVPEPATALPLAAALLVWWARRAR